MYIAAVDIDWDFVPRKLNTVTMTDLKDPKTYVKIVVVLPNCLLCTVKTHYVVHPSFYIGCEMKSVLIFGYLKICCKTPTDIT